MYIIFGTELAAELRQRYIVLELETFDINGTMNTAFCVVQPEAIALGDLPDIERLSRLHQALADALKIQDYSTVSQAIDHLMGKFGGSLDSFYQIIADRIKEQQIDSN